MARFLLDAQMDGQPDPLGSQAAVRLPPPSLLRRHCGDCALLLGSERHPLGGASGIKASTPGQEENGRREAHPGPVTVQHGDYGETFSHVNSNTVDGVCAPGRLALFH